MLDHDTQSADAPDQVVALTILQQLGGSNALSLMVGARDFLSTPDALQFRIAAKNPRRVQYVHVRLDASDTYTVTTSRWDGRKLARVTIDEASEVYADNLIDCVERLTDLCLRLPRIRR